MSGATPRLALIIIDGFGVSTGGACDAIAAAAMPNWRALCAQHPHTTLGASGEAVGLPAGQMGNSEVGHLNIGSGQRVPQDLPRIDAAIADGSFAQMGGLRSALAAAQRVASRSSRCLGVVGYTPTTAMRSRCCAPRMRLVSRAFSCTSSSMGVTHHHALLPRRLHRSSSA